MSLKPPQILPYSLQVGIHSSSNFSSLKNCDLLELPIAVGNNFWIVDSMESVRHNSNKVEFLDLTRIWVLELKFQYSGFLGFFFVRFSDLELLPHPSSLVLELLSPKFSDLKVSLIQILSYLRMDTVFGTLVDLMKVGIQRIWMGSFLISRTFRPLSIEFIG